MKVSKWILLVVAAVLFVSAQKSLAGLHTGGGTGDPGTGTNPTH